MAGPNLLSAGIVFIDEEPMLLIQMRSEWRSLPYENAVLFIKQLIDLVEAIKPTETPSGAEVGSAVRAGAPIREDA